MKYKHLNREQRYEIGAYLASGMKQKFIAEKLHVSVSTISREKKRNSTKIGTYNAQKAQELTNERKERFCKNRRFTSTVKTFVEEKIRQEQWSPQQIVGYCKKEGITMVSVERIYQHIREDKSKGGSLYKHMRHQLKHRKKGLHKKQCKVEDKRSIEERPAIVDQNTEFGHWEIDLIVGAGNKGAILTLVERKTKMLFIKKLPQGKKAKPLANMVVEIMLPYKNCIKTITSDNGKEFSEFKIIEKKLNLTFYFSHAYSSWERGLSEHSNRNVRQYIPKNTDFREITDNDIKLIQYKINNRPREVLGFEKPKDLFYKFAN